MVEVAREDERREEDLRVLDIERGAGAVSSRLGSTPYIPHPRPHSTHPEAAYTYIGRSASGIPVQLTSSPAAAQTGPNPWAAHRVVCWTCVVTVTLPSMPAHIHIVMTLRTYSCAGVTPTAPAFSSPKSWRAA